MKTILVATDFSETAENAAVHACEIARLFQARIILFHAYHVPIITAETAAFVQDFTELEKESMKGLRIIQQKLQSKFGPDVSIDCETKCGFAVDEINTYAEKNNVDLIVMGTHGAGYIMEKLIGSVTSEIIRNAKRPVLAVNKTSKFNGFNKIALACDYLDTENNAVLEPLKAFVNLFKSHLYVVHIANDNQPVFNTKEAASDFVRLEESLAKVDHSFHYLSSDNTIEAINQFVKSNGINMVVMIPRKHSLLRNLFHESNSKQMAFHSQIPLLTLH